MLGNPAGGASKVTPVMQALTDAANNKKDPVRVRMILNNFPAGPNAWPAYGPQIITNEQNWGKSSKNITITLASAGFKFTHNKYMVIDYQTTGDQLPTTTSMVMTGNLTAGSFPDNGQIPGQCKNFYIQDNDSSHIAFLHNLFETDLNNATNNPQTTNTPTYTTPYKINTNTTPSTSTSAPAFDLFVSSPDAPYPANNVNNFVNFINNATEYLDIYMMYFDVYNPNYNGVTGEPNPNLIITAIQNAGARGVTVRILCSNLASQVTKNKYGYYDGDGVTLALLSVSENISIAVPQVLYSPGKAGYYDYKTKEWTTEPKPGVLDTAQTNDLLFIHTKVYIADKKRVMLGSMNMSNTSLMKNRELDITSSDTSLVTPVLDSFNTDWTKYYPQYKYTTADSWATQYPSTVSATENEGKM
jgi:phosphatidylserine/phosphatidylglycerophosphate/cardiolipin synthase-like enzyme